MNITIVQGPYQPVPPITGGAVEKLWFDLGREFARRGHTVHHVSRRFPGLPDQERIDGVEHRRLASLDRPVSPVLSKLGDLLYSLRCAAAAPWREVVVTNTFFLPMLYGLVPRRGRVLYVSVHRYPQGQMGWYRSADRLQCVSTAVADAVREQSPSVAPQVKVIPNYVNSWRDIDSVTAGWTARPKEILFVGRIHVEKGVDLLVRAMHRVPPARREGWTLRIVGPHESAKGGGGDAYKAEIEALVRSLDVKVDWVGPVFDRDVLNDLYARARIFVYPSIAALGEALPLAPLEAMSQGCAILTSDLACFRDYLRPGENGDCFKLDEGDRVDNLASGLAALMGDEARARRLALAGLATVPDFSLERVADRLLEDFAALARR